jgi:predicted RNA-binding protein YlxR (DUF448 family)
MTPETISSPKRRRGPKGPRAGARAASQPGRGGPSSSPTRPRSALHEHKRTCVGCGKREDVEVRGSDLVRVVRAPSGEIAVDASAGGGALGSRGANLHTRRACIARAAERSLGRALGGPITADAAAIEAMVIAALVRRLGGLLASARGRRELVIGAEACEEQGQRLGALLVATDAGSSQSKRFVGEAVERGVAVALGRKAELAAWMGQERSEGVALLGVAMGSVAAEVLRVARAVAAFGSRPSAARVLVDSTPGGVESRSSGSDASSRDRSRNG